MKFPNVAFLSLENYLKILEIILDEELKGSQPKSFISNS